MRLLEVHLEVADLPRSVAFYRKLLPYEKEIKDDSGNQVFLVLADGTAFGLWNKGYNGVKNGRGGEHVHFAFQILPDEYEAYKLLLIELGVEPLEQLWKNGSQSLYFFDFDGHQGEFMTRDWAEKEI